MMWHSSSNLWTSDWQKFETEIRDTNGPRFAGLHDLLHCLPRVNESRLSQDHFAIGVTGKFFISSLECDGIMQQDFWLRY